MQMCFSSVFPIDELVNLQFEYFLSIGHIKIGLLCLYNILKRHAPMCHKINLISETSEGMQLQ